MNNTMNTTTNPAHDMLESARRAHAALSSQRPTFATVQIHREIPVNEEADRRQRLQANRELTAAVPAAKRLQIIYAPLLAKTLCSDLCQTIVSTLKQNNITDTKNDVKFLQRYRQLWDQQLYSPDMPKGAETVIRTLAQWWRDDGTDSCLKSLHYAYANHLGRTKGIDGNTTDFLAWIFTARDIARASTRFDDESLRYLKTLPQSKPYRLRRNADDYAYRLAEFCSRLVRSAFGRDYDPSDPSIATGRNALYNRLALYDAATALSEYWALDGMQRSGKQCPAQRCSKCQLRDGCKTLQRTTRDMHKNN